MNIQAQKQFVERLHSSAAAGNIKEVEALLKGGVDANAKNDRGWTAAMFAARNGHNEILKVLLANGADQTIVNSSGQTALDIASFWNHQNVVQVVSPEVSTQQPKVTENIRNFFCDNPLDYASDKRKDEKWLKEKLTEPTSKFILMKDLKPCVFKTEVAGRSKYSLCILQNSAGVSKLLNSDETVKVFLGNGSLPDKEQTETSLEHGASDSSWFVIDASNFTEDLLSEICQNFEILEPLPGLLQLSRAEASICAQARTMLDWHQRYKFCPTCGSVMSIKEGGYKKVCNNQECTSHKGVHNVCYPRTDPSVIMLVISPDRQNCLLGRAKRFPAGMWSCLAGFMEPGESIEDCCRREVKEESDITVGHVEYHSSQPWPFPCSLMIGCLAYAESDKITVDKEELEDARWFSRQQIVQMLTRQHQDGLYVPPDQAIAHQLIKTWVKMTSNL